MSERICMFCKHFRWATKAWAMGSEWTGPYTFDPGGTKCDKGHMKDVRGEPEDESEFRQIILRAETCPDYEVPEDA